MEAVSEQPTTILYSPAADGNQPGNWQGEMVSRAYKICQHCGADFWPWQKIRDDGTKTVQSKPLFEKARFCSISCAKKKENAMWVPGAKDKMSATLKKIGHRPLRVGGNGRGMTAPQETMLSMLPPGWEPEVAIPTGIKRAMKTHPTCYKVDIGNRSMKVAIELDGNTHYGARKDLDKKKDDLLASLGWKVFRVRNADAMSMCTTCKSADTLLTLLMAY